MRTAFTMRNSTYTAIKREESIFAGVSEHFTDFQNDLHTSS